MMKNCSCRRSSCDPSGVWDYKNLIGSTVTIKSLPVGNCFKMTNTSEKFKIKDIYFRVSLDGKAITLVELEGDDMVGIYFTLKDLIFVEINDNPNPICGQVISGITKT